MQSYILVSLDARNGELQLWTAGAATGFHGYHKLWQTIIEWGDNYPNWQRIRQSAMDEHVTEFSMVGNVKNNRTYEMRLVHTWTVYVLPTLIYCSFFPPFIAF